MSQWPASKARKVYRALLRIGWTEHHLVKGSSHQQMTHPNHEDFTWGFHDGEEIGPRMMARIGKRTGLTPEDL